MNYSHKSKPKLFIHTDSLNSAIGGVYEYTKNIIFNFKNQDYKLITNKHHQEFDLKKQVKIPRRKLKLYGTFRNNYLIPKLLKKSNATHFWQPDHLLPLYLPKNLKKIITVHDLSSIFYTKYHTFQNQIGHKLLFAQSLLKADLILTPSNTVRSELLANFKLNCPVQTVYNGCNHNPSIIPPLNAIKQPFFLYVGTIEPRKNLKTLIQAFQKIQTKIPEKLIFIGNQGWKSNQVHSLIKNDPRITYLGQLSEPEKNYYIKTATALIYPSIYEGFGLPPLEAMNIGTPVITSNIPVFQEIYQDYSIQFNTESASDLSQKMLEISQNQSLRIRLIQKGKSLAQKLNWQNTAQKIEQLIFDL